MLSTSKLQELKAMAEKATPGPWEYTGCNGVDYECEECGNEFPESGWGVKSKDEHQVLECHLYGMERFCKPDGEFIASANPQIILSLIEEIEASRGFITELVDKYFDLLTEDRMGPKKLKEHTVSLLARAHLAKFGGSDE